MSNEIPPNPLTNTYQPSAWEDDETAITKENINKYAVTFPISQNSPITISNTLSVGGLITGNTATATANDNSTKLASTSYADNAASQSASSLLADTNTWTGVNTFSNTNNNFIGTTTTQSQGETDTTKLANLLWVTTRVNNTASDLASLSLNNTFTGVNTFNNDVFIGNSGLLTCGQVNSGEIIGLAPTQTAGDNSTKLSTTAYADTSSATATNTLQNVLLTGNLTYSGDNTYTGTTNLNGAVNATSTNNFIAGNSAGGEVQLNSKKTFIGTGGLGNTDNVSIANGTNTTGSFVVVGSPTLGGAYLRAVTVYINDFGTGATSIGNSTGNTTIIGANLIVPSSQGQNVFSSTDGLRMNTGGGVYSTGNEPVAQFGSNISMINNKRIIWYYNWSIWGSSGGTFNFFYGGNPEGATTGVASIGTNGAYTQISDISKKTQIEDITYGLDTINQLRPVSFFYKTDLEDKQVGFIAQEVNDVLPEAIQIHKDEEDLMFIDKSSIIPVLVKAIQELTEKVETLEKRLQKLE